MKTNMGHSGSTRLLHWTMALIIVSMLYLGSSMIQSLDIWQVEAVKLHKSFGILALVLVIIRLFNKLLSRRPPLPNDLPKWQKFAAHITHFGLYTLMLAMPLSGWLMQSAGGRVVSLFGWITLPQLVE